MRANIPNVVHETIDGETILLNLKTGNYYSFEGLGAFIWNFIDREAGWSLLPSLVSKVCNVETEEVRRDIHDFVKELEMEELVVEEPLDVSLVDEKVDSYVQELMTLGTDYSLPVVNKYSDMQDLLLLDPIHDVSQKGWPQKKDSN